MTVCLRNFSLFHFLEECVNVFVCLGPYVFVLVLQCVRAFGALLH